MKRWAVGLVPVVALVAVGQLQASVVINFEFFIIPGAKVGLVPTADNRVTFSVGPGNVPESVSNPAAPPSDELGFVIGFAQPSFIPVPSDAHDAAGGRFWTDEQAGGSEPQEGLNYFIAFDDPVLNLSLDLFDFRDDDGGAIGESVTLTVFSHSAFNTPIGNDVFTVTSGLPDGNVAVLSVPNPGGLIRSASLIFSGGVGSRDLGTGIDNVAFQTAAPEPATFVVWSVLATLGITAGWCRRRKR